MNGIISLLRDSGIVGWCILLVGFGTLYLVFERSKSLFVSYKLDYDAFYDKIQSLILNRKAGEAIVMCEQLGTQPIGIAYKTILQKFDYDNESIYQAHDIALSESVPMITRRVHYLSMLANVSTLLGLLGTIHGLIISFAAVAQADPAQKQALLANGISVSMYTTALGLIVAIPAMVAYSIIVSRQNYLVEQITEKCGRLAELMTSGHIVHLRKFQHKTNAEQIQHGNLIVPPAPNAKAN